MSEATERALEAIAQVAERPVDQIDPEMDLVADLGIDSPKALQLLIEIEERLGIEISDEEAAQLNSVRDILACAERVPTP